MKKTIFSLLALTFVATGCSGALRDAEMYRADTAKVFETKSADLSNCYNEVLKSNKDAAGTVAISFKWSKEDGALKDAAVLADQTTAPEPVQQCVLTSLGGLVLSPKDVKDGIGTWTFDFKPAN